jgi:rifampicin phosphotransferase
MISIIGGKALGLHQLRQQGIAVPIWATLTTEFFQKVCSRDAGLAAVLAEKQADDIAKAEQLRSYIAKLEFNAEEKALLRSAYLRISEGGARSVAVRSSAVEEDSSKFSFAGQLDSFLHVRKEEMFLTAVRGCWASLFGERAVRYRLNNGLDLWQTNMAVIVQQMIEAEASGVLFTLNPITGNRDEMLINSTWGLGDGLVAGAVDADTFILGSSGNILSSRIGEKDRITVPGVTGGTELRDTPADRRSEASLSNAELTLLHRLAMQMQEYRKMPLDIEFAAAKGTLYLLQSRPITAISSRDNFKVWDNSNIVESYSGVTTPLTFSFIRKAYFAVYCQFCEVIGVDRKTIFKNRHVFENMLGLIQGRVYYNLLNWYTLVSLMPGFTYNRRFMEQMMGLQVIKDFTIREKPSSLFERYAIELPKLMKVGLKMVLAHISLPGRIKEFHTDFDKVYSHYSSRDFDKMTPFEILGIYRILEEEVLWKWKAPILNDFEAMIFYGLLKKITSTWGLDEEGTLQNDLLCGEGGIRSTSVTTELFRIAKEIGTSGLKEMFLELRPEEALIGLRTLPAFSGINQSFNQYLAEYGVRSIDEMKLESVSVKDNPVFCIAMLQNYLRHEIPGPEKQREHELMVRNRAEHLLKERIRRHGILPAFFRFTLYRWVLKNTRRAIRNRENQRFARAEAYSLVRSMVRSIGRSWRHKGIIDNEADIFYLDLNEIWSYIEGTSTCPDLRRLSALRKEEFGTYSQASPDDHIETYGEVYTANRFVAESATGERPDVLKGLGCCQGIVEREVKIVIKPDSELKLNGEIMVARQTDPGWVVLFPSVSGLIIEKGSMLSHSAIVAREMGIPAVVGVKNASNLLRTGDLVRLDGAKGEITILKRAGN